jgi:hypothetical protein
MAYMGTALLQATPALSDFPEPGLNVATCFLHLGRLGDRYAGGLLTTKFLCHETSLATNPTRRATFNPP